MDVVVIDSTWETVVSNVINCPRCAIAELNAIAKIHKYKRFQEGQHFILMAMEVPAHPGVIWIVFIKEHVHLFHDR